MTGQQGTILEIWMRYPHPKVHAVALFDSVGRLFLPSFMQTFKGDRVFYPYIPTEED